MNRIDLPPQRAAVLAFLRRELAAGRAPSLADIADAFGFASRNAAQKHVQALVADALLEQAPGQQRGLRLPGGMADLLPLPVLGRVAAGPPMPRECREQGRNLDALVDQLRHGADRIDQHAGGLAREMAGDVGLGLAQDVVADGLLGDGIGGEQAAHAAALVAGDHHHGTVGAADLLVAAALGGGHPGHGLHPPRRGGQPVEAIAKAAATRVNCSVRCLYHIAERICKLSLPPPSDPAATRALLHSVAKMHYEAEMSQVDIAKRLGVSTATVSRMLQRARNEGIVRIEIPDLVAADELGVALRQRLALKAAAVVETRITQILEDGLSGIEGIKTIQSSSRNGRSDVTIEFNLSRDIEASNTP